MCQHWGEHGFGAPWGVVLLYVLKVVLFLAGALAFLVNTPGVGTLDTILSWWTAPVVFEKLVLWGVLFEVLGLGCGFGPLTLRFLPPVGGFLHWLRPGTIRLPPWPGRVPLTRGTRRTWFDLLLYAALLASLVWPLVAPATRTDAGLLGPVAVLAPDTLVPFSVLLPLLGLRDKTIFLAARAEYYWVLTLAFFLPYLDMVITLKCLVVLIWWGAATSKLNRMFPYTVAAMFSNAPLPPKFLRRRMFRSFPQDMRPSSSVTAVAYFGVFVEFTAPLVLLVSTNLWVTLGAIAVMLLFHLNILAALPLGAPLEWNVFVIFSTGYLFYGHFSYNLSTAPHPLAPALLAIPAAAMITWGNLRPDQVSFLLSMRYYAGNWGTSLWAFKPSAIEKIDRHVTKASKLPKQQLKRMYGEQVAEVMAHKVATWRSLHHHGRALFGLLPRAAGAKHERAIVIDGEMVAGTMLGWDFAEGHLHNEQLVDALRERCDFEPGEVRVVVLESAAFGSDRQEYRLVDGAIGTFERGFVRIRDMLDRQPWEIDDLPAYVLRRMTDVPGDELLDEHPDLADRVAGRQLSRPDPATTASGSPSVFDPTAGEPGHYQSADHEPGDQERAPGAAPWDDAEIGPQDFRPLGAGTAMPGPAAYSEAPEPDDSGPDGSDADELPRLPQPKNTTETEWPVRHAGTG